MTKPSGRARGKKSKPIGDIAILEAAFAVDPRQTIAVQRRERADRLHPVIEWIGNRLIDVVGTSGEFDVYLGEPENIEPPKPRLFKAFLLRPLCIYRKNETRSEDDVRRAVSDLLSNAIKALKMLDLSLSDGMAVIDSVLERIKTDCAVTYAVVNGTQIRRIDDRTPFSIESEGEVITTPPTTAFPAEVRHALDELERSCGKCYVVERTYDEIEPLNLADRVIEIKRRIEISRWYRPYYKIALEAILATLEREVELQKLRKAIHESVKTNDEPKPKDAKAIYDDELDKKRKPEGKLEFREIMVLLSEFIPAFGDADNTKKARFITAISPYESVKRIGDEFSYIDNFGKEHAELVKYWQKELKRTKRGRPRLNKYRRNTPVK